MILVSSYNVAASCSISIFAEIRLLNRIGTVLKILTY